MIQKVFWSILLLLIPVLVVAGWQGGITVFGRVYLPDGQPADGQPGVRAKVRIEIVNGFWREVWSDDQGRYEFRGIPSGRYRISATNPEVAEQYTEPAESDSTRSFANRLQVDLFLRLPVRVGGKETPPGVVTVEEAAQRIPGGARKFYEEGMRLLRAQDEEGAVQQLTRAIEDYPDYFQALTERGNVAMGRNRFDEAARDFGEALRVNRRYAPAWRGLGYCQLQQRRFEEGVASLEQAYAAAPRVPLTLLLLGYGNLSLNRYEPARQCLEEALRLDEKSAARAHVYLGEIVARSGEYERAADHIKQYLRLNPAASDGVRLRELEDGWRRQARK